MNIPLKKNNPYKLDVTVIVLTYNEEIHIERCIRNVKEFASEIYVVDCNSTDRTVELCIREGVKVVTHDWPGNQAEQFNWAIDNLAIHTTWIIRLDADEYLLPDLITELREKLPGLDESVTGLEFRRRNIFMNRWVKHGTYPTILLRAFRVGCARYDKRLMDEHLILNRGRSLLFEKDFCDHTLMSISDYCKKHINYAEREAVTAVDLLYHISQRDQIGGDRIKANQNKRHLKYYKLPIFWRAFVFFFYKYVLKGGFLDGKAGFIFSFVQCWWYRTIVDVNINEILSVCGNNKNKIKDYVFQRYKIIL